METGWNMLKDRNETIFQAEEFMIHPRQNRTKTTLSPNSFSKVKVNYFCYDNFFVTPWTPNRLCQAHEWPLEGTSSRTTRTP
jgi:hypothetical protein